MCVGITPLKRSKLKLSGVTCNISTCAFTVNVLGILSANFFLLFRVALLEASVQVVSAAEEEEGEVVVTEPVVGASPGAGAEEGAAGAATETTASAGTRYPHQVSTCTRTEVYTYDTVHSVVVYSGCC